jgi:hypothetical protein
MERIDHLPSVQRWDADEQAFMARELETIKSKTFDRKYPTLRARDFCPVSREAGPGSQTVTYQQWDRVGRARIVGSRPTDVPRVDVSGKEFPRPVRTWADAYGWTVMEVQAAAMARRPLNSMKATAARRAIEEGLDETASVGAPEHGIPTGMINDAAVPTQTVPTGAGGVPWASKTPDEIIKDVRDAIKRIVTVTKGVERPDTILLPDDQHALIATTPRSTLSDTTILEFLLAKFRSQGITAIEPWYRLVGAGAGATDRMIVYTRDEDHLQQEITQEFTTLPVQEYGLEFIIHALAQTAGMAFYYPLSADYSDGI